MGGLPFEVVNLMNLNRVKPNKTGTTHVTNIIKQLAIGKLCVLKLIRLSTRTFVLLTMKL